MDEKQNQNFLLAIVLSMLVVAGWSYFVAWPRAHQLQLQRELEAKQAATQSQQVQPQTGAATSAPATATSGTQAPATPLPPLSAFLTRDAALASSPRVAIDSNGLTGSIALQGARFDDVVLKKYHDTVDPKSANVVLLSPQGFDGGYVADFGWQDADGKTVIGPQTVWQASAGTTLSSTSPITLTTDIGGGITVKRTVSVDDAYMFKVRDEIANASGKDLALRPAATLSRYGEPHLTNQSFEGFVSGSANNSIQQVYYSALKNAAGPETKDTGGWFGFTDKYWAAILIPEPALPYTAELLRTGVDGQPVYSTWMTGNTPLAIPTGQSKSMESRLFAGAKEVDTVGAYESQGIPKFSYVVDWGWFFFLAKPLFWLIDFLYNRVGYFWVAILLTTVVVKTAFFPLANKAFESMSKMKKLQPEMQSIQERFKDDKVRQQQAIMELYKTQGVNPMLGCIPMLLQIPVFFALYKVLYTTLEMRHQPFLGWVHDLSAPDPTNLFNLFGLLPYHVPDSIPYLHLGVWPIIMGFTMWLQMKLNPPPPDPVQARMFSIMPIMFTFMLGALPAGLVIYYAWNNSLTLLQQSYIMRRQGVKVEVFDNVVKDFRAVVGFFKRLAGGSGAPAP
jgi:YidC/Oxa1 family membrane protein insertase